VVFLTGICPSKTPQLPPYHSESQRTKVVVNFNLSSWRGNRCSLQDIPGEIMLQGEPNQTQLLAKVFSPNHAQRATHDDKYQNHPAKNDTVSLLPVL
jgi:hypothetical protein